MSHTVEKIGGTSMSKFQHMLDNVFFNPQLETIYNRVFVVSAYGGVTNMLLEHKKNKAKGVYQLFADNDPTWQESLENVEQELCKINASLEDLGLNVAKANTFVKERIEGVKSCLKDIQNLYSYGHFELSEYLPAIREILSSIGEAHSAYNSVNILKSKNVNAIFVDLTGWKKTETLDFTSTITNAFKTIDFSSSLVIATGYTKCSEGLMKTYDRGYSEITFSKIACVTSAKEGIIHKEFHLSTGDPTVVGLNKVKTIGASNFDVMDQLADLGMEAIHPRASKDMELKHIPIRVKNAFDPEHKGTLISEDFISQEPKVEIITGRDDIVAIEVVDSDMVGKAGYDHQLTAVLKQYNISYIAKNTNANTIIHYIATCPQLDDLINSMQHKFQGAIITVNKVAIVSAIGSNMKFPGFLACASDSLAKANINILALSQCMRQINMQFIVSVADFNKAICALHETLVEKNCQ